jgi:hypothetical protein
VRTNHKAPEATAKAQPAEFEIVTLEQRPDLEDQVERLHEETWDEFLNGAPWNYWEALFTTFAKFQLLFCQNGDELIGLGHTVPFDWDGRTEDLPRLLDDVIRRGLIALEEGRPWTALSALAAMVPDKHQKRGLSTEIIRAMRSLAAQHGLGSVVVPTGPTLKHLYPLTPMDRYAKWKREDGSPFDPWIRVHWKLGGEQLCVNPQTAIVNGTVAQWEQWTGMKFPESGLYIVPGALSPVEIDRERDVGRYDDPGVWMLHRVPEAGKTAC